MTTMPCCLAVQAMMHQKGGKSASDCTLQVRRKEESRSLHFPAGVEVWAVSACQASWASKVFMMAMAMVTTATLVPSASPWVGLQACRWLGDRQRTRVCCVKNREIYGTVWENKKPCFMLIPFRVSSRFLVIQNPVVQSFLPMYDTWGFLQTFLGHFLVST
jgi:hypothetical protein